MSKQKLFDSALTILKGSAEDSSAPEKESASELAPQVRFPLHWLSDLGSGQTKELAPIWRRIPAGIRRDLMAEMEAKARENFELDFLAIARIALHDDDPEVRVHAIRSFWECSDPKLVDRFLQFVERDPEMEVRANASSALGLFVERSELGEIPASLGAQIVTRLIAVIRGKDELEVRRRAVESIGYASDPKVRAILENAYAHPDPRMSGSALRAMGRSADPSWSDIILEDLRNPLPQLRAEAAWAAGALGLRSTVRLLIELLEDADAGVRGNAIDSLGEIGGELARKALEKIQQDANGDEWDRIESALENAEFEDSLSDLPLLNVEEEDAEDGGDEMEEEEEDEDDMDVDSEEE